ncbi:hypothetical protein TNIN_414971 [Trichonephila inaurata madagascariensis]|uniref:Uncharacterized protein n=1 Tax=Trichonephila inaurata madagascariensis TaxID=2747483 RepID=A0A8X7BVR3_9ARAC|nr:hypothetical protein TNIN_414971 [Trichonephila inaurata madagascariensis]
MTLDRLSRSHSNSRQTCQDRPRTNPLEHSPTLPFPGGAINKPQRVTQQPTESSSPDHPLTAQTTSTSTRTLGESVERSLSILSLSVPT